MLGLFLAASDLALPISDADAQNVRAGKTSTKVKSKAAGRAKGRRSSNKAAEAAEKRPAGPLVVTVSLNRQRVTVYDATQEIAGAPISSGRRGRATPTGVFSIVQKRRHHISNIYNVAMPNMQRLTWSGIALHAGVLPGYPASSGCIRLPHGFSRQLFGMTKLGTRVIVTRDPVAPRMIAHERLFGAYPDEDVVALGSGAERVADQPVQVADASPGGGETVAEMLGVSTAHAAAPRGVPAVSATPRERFLRRRAAEAAGRARAIREAGYAWAGKRAVAAHAERTADKMRAVFKEARGDVERIESERAEIEKAMSRATGEISRLEAPAPPAKGKRKSRRAKRKALSEEERAARILELRDQISEAETKITALRIAAGSAGKERVRAEMAMREAEVKREGSERETADAKAALDDALAIEDAAQKREAKRDLPVSVFISRARQRLYVRQGYHDILDVEVSFQKPDEPIGTHVFTALDYAPDIGGMSWSVVSVPHDPSRLAAKKQRKGKQATAKGKTEQARPVLSTQTAKTALERIEIPEYTREAIADLMKPGSSVVISDLGLSNETGKYTDFIVSIR